MLYRGEIVVEIVGAGGIKEGSIQEKCALEATKVPMGSLTQMQGIRETHPSVEKLLRANKRIALIDISWLWGSAGVEFTLKVSMGHVLFKS